MGDTSKVNIGWVVAATVGLLLGAAIAKAATFTWNGGGADANWTTTDNWAEAGAPADDGVADDLIFSGATNTSPNANGDGIWNDVNSINFTGATTAFTLGGDTLNFAPAGVIGNTTAFDHIINNDLVGGATSLDITQDAAGNTLTVNGAIDLSAGGPLNLTPTNGTMIFNGIISGAAAVNVNAGSGKVRLNAVNTYSGGINVNGGTLTLGDAQAVGAIFMKGGDLELDVAASPVINELINTTADFNLIVTQDAEWSGLLTGGAGNVITKQGAGTLTLSADNTGLYAGDLVNDAGRLIFNGKIDGSITNNADMQGTGTIGTNLTNTAGSTLNPGNSAGIMTVNGDFTHQTDATLTIELAPDDPATPAFFPTLPGTHFDQVLVGGQATLESGSVIEVNALNKGYIAEGDVFDVISTVGGVTDNGVQVNSNVHFFDFFTGVAGNSYRLVADRLTYTTAADTTNRTAVALGLDSLASATGSLANNDAETLLAELDWMGPGAGFTSALDYLSSERYDIIDRVHQRSTQAFVDAHRQFLSTRRQGGAMPGTPKYPGLSRRYDSVDWMLASADNSQPTYARYPVRRGLGGLYGGNGHQQSLSAHVAALGQFFSDDNQSDRTGYDADLYGFIAGLDMQMTKDLVGGLLFSYATTNVDFNGLGGDAQIDSYRFGAYADYQLSGQWYVNGLFSWGYHRNDSSRPIIVGTLTRKADAQWSGNDLTFYAETGVNLSKRADVNLTPFVGLFYTYYMQDAFTENTAGAASLAVSEQDTHSLQTLLGVRVSKTFGQRIKITPELSAGWRFDWLTDQNDPITARFAGAPGTFNIDRGDRNKNSFDVGAAVSAQLSSSIDVQARYQGSFSGDGDSHSVGGGVTFWF